MGLKGKERDSENEKLKEELKTSTKDVKRLELVSEFEKKEIEGLGAMIELKLKVIKALEKNVKDNDKWIEELIEGRDGWLDRAEHLEKSRKTVSIMQKGWTEKRLSGRSDEHYD
jgi:hypothetical protein